jgi:hypothetical protein
MAKALESAVRLARKRAIGIEFTVQDVGNRSAGLG